MLERPMLRELGGFRRARRFVDASLLQSVTRGRRLDLPGPRSGLRAATHARPATPGSLGSTSSWTPSGWVRQWDGFEPSRLLEHDDVDKPESAGRTGRASRRSATTTGSVLHVPALGAWSPTLR